MPDIFKTLWLQVLYLIIFIKEMQENNLWVVSRHEIDYLKSAYIHSKLIAKYYLYHYIISFLLD